MSRNQGPGLFGSGPPRGGHHGGGQYSNAPPPRNYQGNYGSSQRGNYSSQCECYTFHKHVLGFLLHIKIHCVTIWVWTWMIVRLDVMPISLISKHWTVNGYFCPCSSELSGRPVILDIKKLFFYIISSNNSKSFSPRCCVGRGHLSVHFSSLVTERSESVNRASVHRRAFSSSLLSTLTLMCQFASWWIISSVGEWSRPAATWCKWRFGVGVDHSGSSLARALRTDAEASN